MLFFRFLFSLFLSFDGCRFSRKSICLTDRRRAVAVANDCEGMLYHHCDTCFRCSFILTGFIMYFRHV